MSKSNSGATSPNSSDEEGNTGNVKEHRTARKSLSQPAQTYVTRRQTARNASKRIPIAPDPFMANFNPETSIREKRKLNRKINPPSNVRRPAGALYDENGINLGTGMDLCDCLNEDCLGCFFQCPKCGSQRCGTECRVHRKYLIEQYEYHGHDHIIKNPLIKH